MNRMKNMTTEWKLVLVLFLLVLVTFSLAQRDSKRLERLYTTFLNQKTNTALVPKAKPVLFPVR
jgi:hypothetical protein